MRQPEATFFYTPGPTQQHRQRPSRDTPSSDSANGNTTSTGENWSRNVATQATRFVRNSTPKMRKIWVPKLVSVPVAQAGLKANQEMTIISKWISDVAATQKATPVVAKWGSGVKKFILIEADGNTVSKVHLRGGNQGVLYPIGINWVTVISVCRSFFSGMSVAQGHAWFGATVPDIQYEQTHVKGDKTVTKLSFRVNMQKESSSWAGKNITNVMLQITSPAEGGPSAAKGPTPTKIETGQVEGNRTGLQLNSNDEESYGSPPGFAKLRVPFALSKKSPQIHCSPRLRKKMNGPYVPMMDRAKRVIGYEEGPSIKQAKTKLKPIAQPQLTYMHSLEPLSYAQAQLVVNQAGSISLS